MAIKRFERDMLKSGGLDVQKKQGDLSYPIHWHDYFEIIYYKNSGGRCLLNGEEYEIADECLFFLTPGDFHRIETVKNKAAFSVKLSFSEEMIDPKLFTAVKICAKSLLYPDPICAYTINKIYELFPISKDISKREIYHLLNTLLAEIIRSGKSAGKEKAYIHPAISKAMLYVLTDLSKDISLTDIASTCSVAPAYFSYIFHNSTGKTFKKWLTEIRVDHACRLLEESDQSVLDICFECGFRTASHFGKAFKGITGMSPREYRKSKNR